MDQDQGGNSGDGEKLLDFEYMLKMELTVLVNGSEVGQKNRSRVKDDLSFWPEPKMICNCRMIVQLQESFSNKRIFNDVRGTWENCWRHIME